MKIRIPIKKLRSKKRFKGSKCKEWVYKKKGKARKSSEAQKKYRKFFGEERRKGKSQAEISAAWASM
jgi:hypothetical protein